VSFWAPGKLQIPVLALLEIDISGCPDSILEVEVEFESDDFLYQLIDRVGKFTTETLGDNIHSWRCNFVLFKDDPTQSNMGKQEVKYEI
jgi:hypothetical protein